MCAFALRIGLKNDHLLIFIGRRLFKNDRNKSARPRGGVLKSLPGHWLFRAILGTKSSRHVPWANSLIRISYEHTIRTQKTLKKSIKINKTVDLFCIRISSVFKTYLKDGSSLCNKCLLFKGLDILLWMTIGKSLQLIFACHNIAVQWCSLSRVIYRQLCDTSKSTRVRHVIWIAVNLLYDRRYEIIMTWLISSTTQALKDN